jgi:hypothetical protein
MRLLIAFLAFAALALTASAIAGDGHVKAALEPANDSGVSGFVQLAQLPEGSNVHVVVHGLAPGQEVNSFYYDDTECSVDPELVGSITANGGGTGSVHAKIDDDVDEVGSISVRIPPYSTLLACAATQ